MRCCPWGLRQEEKSDRRTSWSRTPLARTRSADREAAGLRGRRQGGHSWWSGRSWRCTSWPRSRRSASPRG
eukprot:57684-Hanusia_phi.AAC.5